METVDYVYRFDPRHPAIPHQPRDAEAARKALEDGNRMFSRWIARCRAGGAAGAGGSFVVPCNIQDVGMVPRPDELPKQAPFAVVVGCSDARVPLEMLFGQGFNKLFVIRVAGNVMGDVCLGSVDFALTALIESVKVVVMLGHVGCGAVAATVDTYLDPVKFRSKTTSHPLRSIQERIFVAVRGAANGLQEVWGDDVTANPHYRTALIEVAVALNAAHSAFDLRQEIARAGKTGVEVLFGVYCLKTHQVSMPVIPDAPVADENVHLAHAPTDPLEFKALATRMAQILKAKYVTGAVALAPATFRMA